MPSLNSCRMCGATSYRRVIDRSDDGAMRATGRYRCSGCSVVFADPKAWREGEANELVADGVSVKRLTPVGPSASSRTTLP